MRNERFLGNFLANFSVSLNKIECATMTCVLLEIHARLFHVFNVQEI